MTEAIRVHRPGGPEVLTPEQIEVGDPGPGEVLVRHTAIGVNFIDVYHRAGLYPHPLPFVPGGEAAGVVEKLGPGVTEVREGERVVSLQGPGAYAGRRLIAAEHLVPLPDAIDDLTAAAAFLKGMTAEYLLRRTFEVGEGTVLLFHAAAGGVGLIACQWAAALGATVIGTVGSAEKAALARRNGCTHVIDYRREDFVARAREITGGAGVDVVYDGVGKSTFPGSLDVLKRRGLWVTYGQSSGPVPAFDPLELRRRGSLYCTRPAIADYVSDRPSLLAAAGALFEAIASGAVTVAPGKSYPLAEAAEAHRALEERRTTGSTVLIP